MKLLLFHENKALVQQLPILFDSREFEREESLDLADLFSEIENTYHSIGEDTIHFGAIIVNKIGDLSIARLYRIFLDWEGTSQKSVTLFLNSAEAREFLLTRELSPEPMRQVALCFGREVEIRTGDITRVQAAAIVNASNTRLKLGAGVSGALRKAAGDRLQQEMNAVARQLNPGDVVITPSGLPSCAWVLHAATADGQPETIRRALVNIFHMCTTHRIASVAIPALGTGTGGLPVKRFAQLFNDTLQECFQAEAEGAFPAQILVVLYSLRSFEVFQEYFHGPRT